MQTAVGLAPLARSSVRLGCTVAAKEGAPAQKLLPVLEPAVTRRGTLLAAAASVWPTKSALGLENREKEGVEGAVEKDAKRSENATKENGGEGGVTVGKENTGGGRTGLEFQKIWDGWPVVAQLGGFLALAASVWVVAGKPIATSAVKQLDEGPTRDFLLKAAITTALKTLYQAPPVQSGGVSIPLLDRKEKELIFNMLKTQTKKGALFLRGPSNTGKTTLVQKALDNRTNVIVVELRRFENDLKEGFKEVLGLGANEEISLREIVQILRKLWASKKGGEDMPVIFLDDAHLLRGPGLRLDESARKALALLLEVAYSGVGYVILGTSEEAGAEDMMDDVLGAAERVTFMTHKFPTRDEVISYLDKNLKCLPDDSKKMYECLGGHLGGLGNLVKSFQGRNPTSAEVDEYLATLESSAGIKIRKAVGGAFFGSFDPALAKWSLTIMKEIKADPDRRTDLGLQELEKKEVAKKLVELNVLRQNADASFSSHSSLYEYTFARMSWQGRS